jgi:hypothetical protein
MAFAITPMKQGSTPLSAQSQLVETVTSMLMNAKVTHAKMPPHARTQHVCI